MVRRRVLLCRQAGVGGGALAQRRAGDAACAATRFHDIFSLAPPRTARQLRVDACIFRGVVGARRYHAARARGVAGAGGRRIRRTSSTKGFACCASSIRTRRRRRSAVFGSPSRTPSAPWGAACCMTSACGRINCWWASAPAPADRRRRGRPERFAAVGERAACGSSGTSCCWRSAVRASGCCASELCAAWGPRSHNLAGRLSVFGSASVLSQCATFIGNDSGPTHLAAMVGIPCVAIFSARNAPGQWEPLGEHHVVHRRPARVRRLHARRLRARSEEVPDAH